MYRHILIPVALDHEHPVDEALGVARRLLAEDGRIEVLHVLEALPTYATQYLPEDHLKTRSANAEERLTKDLGGAPEVDTAVIVGHAGRSIVEYAVESGTDCIVIASHRPGLQDYLLGSTAGRVVRHSPCAVHVLR